MYGWQYGHTTRDAIDVCERALRLDPTDATVLYCGNDVGVFKSTNSGGSWTKFGTGLPATSVQDIQILRPIQIFDLI